MNHLYDFFDMSYERQLAVGWSLPTACFYERKPTLWCFYKRRFFDPAVVLFWSWKGFAFPTTEPSLDTKIKCLMFSIRNILLIVDPKSDAGCNWNHKITLSCSSTFEKQNVGHTLCLNPFVTDSMWIHTEAISRFCAWEYLWALDYWKSKRLKIQIFQ